MHYEYTHYYQMLLLERTSEDELKHLKNEAKEYKPTRYASLNERGIDVRGLACTNPDCKYDNPVPAVQTEDGILCRSCLKRSDTNAPNYKDNLEQIIKFLLDVEKLMFALDKKFIKELFYLKYGEDPQDYIKSIRDDMQSLHPSNYIIKKGGGLKNDQKDKSISKKETLKTLFYF